MSTARGVSWNLFIVNLYKWTYKEFLLFFVSANEQPPPPPYNTAFAIGLVMFESQYTVLSKRVQASHIDLLMLI